MTSNITVPGSKSLTNRALLLASLAKGTSTLHNVLLSDDTNVMISALKQLGVNIQQENNTLTITSSGKFEKPDSPIYLGNAGTAVRFLTAMLSHQPFETTLEGDDRMQERPIKDLIDALSELGANIDSPTGCPPLTIHGTPLTGSETHISGHKSSQYISALLMLGPLLENGLTLTIDDEATSKSYIDITLDLMNTFCVQNIKNSAYKSFKIDHKDYCPQTLTIEADASSATYFFGLAAITGKAITIEHISTKTLQPDIKILKHLEQMGCEIIEDKNGITVTGPNQLKALGIVDANDFPDGAMTLAVVAAFAHGKTTLTGLHNLKIKESDRLEALKTELTKMGADVTTTEDSITINGDPTILHSATIGTYNDHRMAMCFGMAGRVVQDLEIENPGCVAKTYPHFWDDLNSID
jgi:3-phosphoshikimate 1-carboxyvinyltransferase